MDIFINKHRILSLIRLAMAYVATNVEVAYLAQFLAFESEKEAMKFLTGIGCKTSMNPEDGKVRLLCRDSVTALKKAPLKAKEKMK